MKYKINLSKEEKEVDQKILLEFIGLRDKTRKSAFIELGLQLDKVNNRIGGIARAYIGLDDLIDEGLVCEGKDNIGLFFELTPRGKQKYDLVKLSRDKGELQKDHK